MAKDVGPYRWVAVGEMVHFEKHPGLVDGVGPAVGMCGTFGSAESVASAHNDALAVGDNYKWSHAANYIQCNRTIAYAKDEADASEIAECHNRCLSELRGEHVPAGQVDLDDPKAVLCRFMRALGLRVSFSAGEAGTRWVAAVERGDVTVSERDAKALIEVARGLA